MNDTNYKWNSGENIILILKNAWNECSETMITFVSESLLCTVSKNVSLRMIIIIMITQPLVHFGQIGDARKSSLSELWVFSELIPPEAWSQSTCWPLAPALLLGITYSAIVFQCGNQPIAWRIWWLPPEGCEEQLATQHSLWQEQNVFSSLHVSIRSVSEVYRRKEKRRNWLTL